MAKFIRTIYLYIVALATLAMVVVSIVGTVGNFVAYLKPVVYVYGYYPEYKEEVMQEDGLVINEYTKTTSSADTYNKELQKVKRTNLKNMITNITIFVVGAPLFVFHWKLIEKERKEMEG